MADAASHETPMSGAGWVLIPWQTPPEDLRRRIAASYDMVRRPTDNACLSPRRKRHLAVFGPRRC
jgi:hypothetical protein